jgi:hypothetical protein
MAGPRVGRLILIGAVLVGGGAIVAPTAAAHGPCGCLDPAAAPAGVEVRVGGGLHGARLSAYRVVLNPRPSDYGIAPRYLASAYRADAPTVTLLSRSARRPVENARVRVPKDMPPGLYMVLVWDGEEGGAHNTWGYLHVLDPDDETSGGVVAPSHRPHGRERTPAGVADPAGEPVRAWPWAIPAAGVGMGIGLLGGRYLRRRR